MRAKVITEFKTLPPGEKKNRTFRKGDEVEGEVAQTAVDNGFATEIVEKPAKAPGGAPKGAA